MSFSVFAHLFIWVFTCHLFKHICKCFSCYQQVIILAASRDSLSKSATTLIYDAIREKGSSLFLQCTPRLLLGKEHDEETSLSCQVAVGCLPVRLLHCLCVLSHNNTITKSVHQESQFHEGFLTCAIFKILWIHCSSSALCLCYCIASETVYLFFNISVHAGKSP